MSRISLRQVLDGICQRIQAQFPERRLYTGQLPETVERPSFFLRLVTTASRRWCVGADETQVYFTLTVYGELAGEDSLTALLEDAGAVADLFRLGVLPVADRMLPVTVADGGQSEGEAYLELTVTLRDGVGYDPEEGLPLVEGLGLVTALADKTGDPL